MNQKFILIFHNNPLSLGGSKSFEDIKILLDKCEKLIFVSNWVKEKFFEYFSTLRNVKSFPKILINIPIGVMKPKKINAIIIGATIEPNNIPNLYQIYTKFY